jgi:hypothetical protein
MGCDFYIYKKLYIYYKNKEKMMITLSSNQGWFYDCNLDSDEVNYEKKLKKSENEQLKPSHDPIIIYKDDSFINKNLEIKYKEFIEDSLKINWTDIDKIVKVEERWERF